MKVIDVIDCPDFLSDKLIVRGCERVLQFYRREYNEVCIVFMDDDSLLEYNRKYLNHDYYTDVITFDYTVDDVINGDVLISLDRVLDNGQGSVDEFYRVISHGILHLIGFNDKSEIEVADMRKQEELCIKMFHVEQ